MTSRYPIQGMSYVVGYHTAIENNQRNIVDAVKKHATKQITKDDEERIIREVVFAAHLSVAPIVDDGPNKSDKEWKAALKAIKMTLTKLEKLDFVSFSFLDTELQKDEDRYQVLKYYGQLYGLPEGSALTTGALKTHLIKSLMLMDDLLSNSLKGVPEGRSRERDPLINYCFYLYRVFKKYTGRGLTLNGPFESFAWQCIEPLQGIIKHSYSEESLRKSIRWLKNNRGAEIKQI